MPLRAFVIGGQYLWDEILTELTPFGYPAVKRGALIGPRGRPVCVFLSQDNSVGYQNSIVGDDVWMQYDKHAVAENAAIRAEPIAVFYRARGTERFCFRGVGRLREAHASVSQFVIRLGS